MSSLTELRECFLCRGSGVLGQTIEEELQRVEGQLRMAEEYWKRLEQTRLEMLSPKDDRMMIAADLTTKTPQPGTLQFPAYVDRFRRLVTDDPRQMKFEVADINDSKSEG